MKIGRCNEEKIKSHPGSQKLFHDLQKLTAHNIPFTWTPELQEELEKMKAALKQVVKLSPLDVTRKLYAYTDAEDTEYCQMVHHLERGHDLKHI